MKASEAFYSAGWGMVSISLKLLVIIDGVSLEEVHGSMVSNQICSAIYKCRKYSRQRIQHKKLCSVS